MWIHLCWSNISAHKRGARLPSCRRTRSVALLGVWIVAPDALWYTAARPIHAEVGLFGEILAMLQRMLAVMDTENRVSAYRRLFEQVNESRKGQCDSGQ